MKTNPSSTRRRGFTLMETVIAIGVLSVLLTGFLIVFTPAAEGIKKSISVQEADRLVSALENELVTLRPKAGDNDVVGTTGFDKAFKRIKESTGEIADTDQGDPASALFLYQYRGDPSTPRSIDDNTPTPVVSTKDRKVGDGYILVPMMRRKSDANFLVDLPAVEGPVFLVKCVQMVRVEDSDNPGQYALQPLPAGNKKRGQIYDPSPNSPNTAIDDSALYPDAVIAFAAEFYPSATKAKGFFEGDGDAFRKFYEKTVKPTFTRNLAIRR
jgi:prepilin-type N-terminal cleavage/methylation domain-containing protein